MAEFLRLSEAQLSVVCVCGHRRGQHSSYTMRPNIPCCGTTGSLQRTDCLCQDFLEYVELSTEDIITGLQTIELDLR